MLAIIDSGALRDIRCVVAVVTVAYDGSAVFHKQSSSRSESSRKNKVVNRVLDQLYRLVVQMRGDCNF